MAFIKWKVQFTRLGLILILIGSSGLLSACSGGGDDGGATTERVDPTDPVQEKNWDKLLWDKGKWG